MSAPRAPGARECGVCVQCGGDAGPAPIPCSSDRDKKTRCRDASARVVPPMARGARRFPGASPGSRGAAPHGVQARTALPRLVRCACAMAPSTGPVLHGPGNASRDRRAIGGRPSARARSARPSARAARWRGERAIRRRPVFRRRDGSGVSPGRRGPVRSRCRGDRRHAHRERATARGGRRSSTRCGTRRPTGRRRRGLGPGARPPATRPPGRRDPRPSSNAPRGRDPAEGPHASPGPGMR